MTGGRHRSTGEVLESHLAYAQRGDLEGDLATNFAEDVVLLSAEGVHRGHDGVRTLRSILDDYVPAGSYEYCQLEAEGEYGLLVWRAASEDVEVHTGTDAFVVREGLVRAQMIYYATERRPG